MKERLLSLAVAFGLTITATPTIAHHSFSAEFDEKQPVTLEGTLTKMDWVNPHGWIYIDVKGPDGTITNWGVEAGAPNALLRRGLRKVDFPVGTPLVVTGFRAKNGTSTINGKTVKLPDGREFFAGSSDSSASTEPR